MNMNKKINHLTSLKEKQSQLKAKIQKLEIAERNRDKEKDVRRRILVGMYYIEQVQQKGKWDDLVVQMDGYLKNDTDRALFDLIPLQKKD